MPKDYYTYSKENARSLETRGVIDGVTIPDIIQRLRGWGKSLARDMRKPDAIAAFFMAASMLAVVYAMAYGKWAGWF